MQVIRFLLISCVIRWESYIPYGYDEQYSLKSLKNGGNTRRLLLI
jgi:hypothetical protein